jgi:hypothetical protein
MVTKRLALIAVPLAVAGGILSGCGGSSAGSGSGGSASGGSGGSGGAGSPGALSADAKSAATGDIPDNQNFLTFKDTNDGFSMRYPEGWAQKRAATGVTFQDKNNLVRVDIHKGAVPTVASVTADLRKLKAKDPSLVAKAAQSFPVKGKPAIKVVYTTKSAPNPVTGKRVVLTVDRYELSKAGKVAVVDLGTPVGVDNVDAYRMMIESFQWL